MNRQALIAKRPTFSTVEDDGTVTLNPPIDVGFRASIQPIDREQLETNPALRDLKQVYLLYSDTELYTAKASEQEADIVEVYGREFEVITSEAWLNSIRPHYKIMIGR